MRASACVTARSLARSRWLVASSSATLGQVLEIFQSLEFRHLPIVDGKELVGILSERDMRGLALPVTLDEAVIERMNARLATPVSELMSTDVISVEPDASIGEVIDLMIEHRIGAVPVVDSVTGDLVGIVSYIDVLREARDNLD